jgi:hypothetical protein
MQEDIALVGRLPLEACVQLAGGQVSASAEQVGRILLKGAGAGEGLAPGVEEVSLAGDEGGAEGPRGGGEPLAPEGDGGGWGPGEHGEGGDALLAAALVALQVLEGGGGGVHSPERP